MRRATRKSAAISILVIILVLGWAGAAQGVTWTVVCLDPTNSIDSEAANDTGTQQAGSADTGAGPRACIWAGSGASYVSLNPSGAAGSTVRGATATQQAGWAAFGGSGTTRAAIWSGSAGSYVSLHPSGYIASRAYATSGTKQVGAADVNPSPTLDTGYVRPRAALWSGTAGSFVNLNPSGAFESQAYGVSGTQQAGYALISVSGIYKSHACIWTGTAASFVDLNPAGAKVSVAYATCGTQQAGVVDDHAAIWSGTAASFADLNPSGASGSVLYATTGTWQVGAADVGANGIGHAGLWKGTAGSFVDLDALLPTQYRDGASWANSIQAGARDLWVAGGTLSGHAILWHAVFPDVTIRTFFDCNSNGTYEPAGDDKLLPGWQFQVKDSGGNVVGTYTTDANGEIILANLASGTYTVTETLKKDHYATGSASNPRVITVTVGGDSVVWFGVKLDADINQDGVVDSQDFTILKANFGISGTTWTQGNINLDDLVDSQDFTILKANFGNGVPPGP